MELEETQNNEKKILGGGWKRQFRSLFLDLQQSNQNQNYALLPQK